MNDTLLWFTTRAAGIVTLVLLSVVVVLGILTRLRVTSPRWPGFLTIGLHRNLSLMALILLALHIVTAVTDPFTALGWAPVVVPFATGYRTFWMGLGTVSFELMLALIATSLVRHVIGLRVWAFVHWAAYAVWPLAVIHGLGTGTDALSAWSLAITGACVVGVGCAVAARVLCAPTNPLTPGNTALSVRVPLEELR